MPDVDYYYTSISPFTYLGHAAIRAAAADNGFALRPRPVNLKELWAVSGAVLPAERPKVRQDYRIIELKRLAERRGRPINVRPRHWPVDPALADLATCALIATGADPLEFMEKLFSGLWARQEDIGDRDRIAAYLGECGFDADAILEKAAGAEAAAMRAENSRAAVEVGLPGVPGYVLAGEPFFGQDRIEDLVHALSSGRRPFDAS